MEQSASIDSSKDTKIRFQVSRPFEIITIKLVRASKVE